MVQFWDEIPDFVVPWIHQQKMFWVATAPLSQEGHVNLSPKGFEGTFHIVDKSTVWYEDLSGSGVETISHLRENGRITIMFCAFEGPPRIVRLWGTGVVHEFDTPEYNSLIPVEKRQPGSRSVIMQSVHKVSTSCGYSIPFYDFKSHRMKLHSMAANKESKDIEAEMTACFPEASLSSSTNAYASATSPKAPPPSQQALGPLHPTGGLKTYWRDNNQKSIDGLPGLLSAFNSMKTFESSVAMKNWGKDDESVRTGTDVGVNGFRGKKDLALKSVVQGLDVRLLVGFLFGFVVCFLVK